MELIYVVIIMVVIILAALIVGWLLRNIVARYENTIDALQRGQADQSKRLEELENAARKSRNPYLTNVGLEDAIAIALDVQDKTNYLETRNQVLQDVLKRIRTDPNSYDENRPNGKREI